MSIANNIKLNSLDTLLGKDNPDNIIQISVSVLKSFKNHPFRISDDDKMDDLVESIKTNGILMPIIVRAAENNYEIISGHRRVFACKKLGIARVPAIIKELDDDEATILMVDSNIQREEILFSEKALAYKMKLDAIKRKAGRHKKQPSKDNSDNCSQIRNNLKSENSSKNDFQTDDSSDEKNSSQVGNNLKEEKSSKDNFQIDNSSDEKNGSQIGNNLKGKKSLKDNFQTDNSSDEKNSSQVGNNLKGKKSLEIMAEELGESKNQIYRYIRLSYLIKPFLEMVDTKTIAFNNGVELSYLNQDEQNMVYKGIKQYEVTPSTKQILRLKEFSKNQRLTEDVVAAILTEEKPVPIKINLSGQSLSKYFPENYTKEEMEKVIYDLLENWSQNNL